MKDEGFDMQFGARPLKRLIQREVMNNISLAMLEDRLLHHSKAVIDWIGEKVVVKMTEKENDAMLIE